MEVWRTVVYDGEVYEDYEVSNFGRVRSLNYMKTGEIKLMKANKKNEYLFVRLSKNGKTKNYLVHRVVAYAWIPNDDPEHKTQINHRNENTHDNRVENLEWVTPKQNANHGTRVERISRSKGIYGVRCIETEEIYDSVKQASEETGIHCTGIYNCCRGRRKKAGGFHWEYVD